MKEAIERLCPQFKLIDDVEVVLLKIVERRTTLSIL